MKTAIDGDLRDLAWSLWSELGVPGWERHHRDVAVDVEPLILFTAALPSLDARLRGEVAGWCASFDRYISKTRLRNLARDQDERSAAAFYAFADALNRSAGLRWPISTKAGDSVDLQARERPMDRNIGRRSACVSLRLRAVFGVGSRAEVIRTMIAYPDTPLSAPEIAKYVFFARRNVAEALDAFAFAGIVGSLEERRTVRYVLAQPLTDVVGEKPRGFPHWVELFGLLLGLQQLLAQPKPAPVLRALQAQEFLETHAFAIARSNLPGAPALRPGFEVFSQLESWSKQIAHEIATNRGDVLSTPRFRPTLLRVRRSNTSPTRTN